MGGVLLSKGAFRQMRCTRLEPVLFALSWVIAAGCSGAIGDEKGAGYDDPTGMDRSDAASPRAGGGGSGGSGGAPALDAGASTDTGTRLDGGATDRAPPRDAGVPSADASRDTGALPIPCGVRITPEPLRSLNGLAPGTRLRLRGDITGTAPAIPRWDWTVRFGTNPNLGVMQVGTNPALVEFDLLEVGNYEITARVSQSCFSTVPASVVVPSTRTASFWVRVTPPPTMAAPLKETVLNVTTGSPARLDLPLDSASLVEIDPHTIVGFAITSYISVTSPQSTVFLEGFNDGGAFKVALAPTLKYRMLLVPQSGTIAPMLLPERYPGDFTSFTFELDAGTAIKGQLVGPDGPVIGGRVLLQADALRSTVGTTNARGEFNLRARAGIFKAVILPPVGSGLPQAEVPDAISIDGTGTPADVRFSYRALATSSLDLSVRTAANEFPAAPVRVRLVSEASALPDVGTWSDDGTTQPARGTVRIEAITDANGVLSLTKIPKAAYVVTLVPGDDGVVDAVTTTRLDLTSGPVARNVRLARKVLVAGRLTSASGGAAGVTVVALATESDVAGSFLTTTTAADGRYEMRFDPGRSYRMFAEPNSTLALPRTPLGGISPTGDLVLTDRTLPRALTVSGSVSADGSFVVGAVVQVFCLESASRDCVEVGAPSIDRVRPLAEAITDANGAYRLLLPDPGSNL